MSEWRKTLDLLVTVADKDPDGALAAIIAKGPPGRVNIAQISYSTRHLDIVKITRADGQEIGLEAEFESWWAEYNGEDADETDKEWARDAFMYGVKYARGKA